jgi:hypothetical protein
MLLPAFISCSFCPYLLKLNCLINRGKGIKTEYRIKKSELKNEEKREENEFG